VTVDPSVGFMAILGSMMFGVLLATLTAGLLSRRDGRGKGR
jgi:hypothetical protein